MFNKEELQVDSFGDRLINLFGIFNKALNKTGADDEVATLSSYHRLNHNELCNLYNKDPLIAKFVDKFPEEAEKNGYVIYNQQGEVIEHDNTLVLEMLKEALIYSRIYGRCYLAMEFESENKAPIMPNDTLKNYTLNYYAEHEHDDDPFYVIENVEYNKTKVYHIIHKKTYMWNVTKHEEQYQIGLIQKIADIVDTYVSSVKVGKYILQNLSYLLMGIKGLSAKSKTDGGFQEILARLVSVGRNRNISRAVAYDMENEQLSFISQTLTGVESVINPIKTLLLACDEYPGDQIFEDIVIRGNPATVGTNNQLINRMLWGEKKKNWSETHFLPVLKQIYYAIYGDGLKIEIPFKVSLTRLEWAQVEKLASERSKNLKDSGIVSPEELRTGYEGDEFTLNITLDDATFKKFVSIASESDGVDKLPRDRDGEEINKDGVIIDEAWDRMSVVTPNDINRTATGVLNQ